MITAKRTPPTALIIGDAAAILVVTWIGFLSHSEGIANLRWLTTFIPLCLAWALQSPWLGLYRPEITCNPRQVWRVVLAALLAAPLAGLLRALMLGTMVIPVFVGVLGGVSALGMAFWRLAYAFFAARAGKNG
jgi:hypothetical protein